MSDNFGQGSLPTSTPAVSTFRAPENKSPSAFRTISEVSTDLAVPQHVLRFWESKFQQIRPLKRGGGRRYYRPEDIQLISSIKDLLYNQGFTIRGAQKHLKETGRPSVVARALSATTEAHASILGDDASALSVPVQVEQPVARGLSPEKRREVEGVLSELKALREFLKQSGI